MTQTSTPQTTNNRPILARSAIALEQEYPLRFLLLGNTGVGKTRLVGEFAADPRCKHMAFVDVDKGVSAIRYGLRKITRFEIPAVNPQTRDLEPFFQSMELARKKIRSMVLAGEVNVVVIDSLSMAAQLCLNDIRAKTFNLALQSGLEPPPVDRADYGRNTTTIASFLLSFRSLPCHLFVTSHTKLDEDENTATKLIGPDLTAALARMAPAHFDTVSYLLMKDQKIEGKMVKIRELLCRPRGFYDAAKDRFDALPDTLPIGAEGGMSRVFDLYEQALARRTELNT